MTYTRSWAATDPSLRQRTRSRTAGLVLNRNWRACMLEEFEAQEDCVLREQDGSYDSSRKTLELLGQVHLAKIITSEGFPFCYLSCFLSFFFFFFEKGQCLARTAVPELIYPFTSSQNFKLRRERGRKELDHYHFFPPNIRMFPDP